MKFFQCSGDILLLAFLPNAVNTTKFGPLKATLKEMNESPCLSSDKTVDVDEIVKQYKFQKKFADRRKDLYSARTYIYEGEEKCDENRDVFLECIETTGKCC